MSSFQRVIAEEWSSMIMMSAFAIMFLVFVINSIRAIILKPDERQHMASLPLDEPANPPAAPNTHSSHES